MSFHMFSYTRFVFPLFWVYLPARVVRCMRVEYSFLRKCRENTPCLLVRLFVSYPFAFSGEWNPRQSWLPLYIVCISHEGVRVPTVNVSVHSPVRCIGYIIGKRPDIGMIIAQANLTCVLVSCSAGCQSRCRCSLPRLLILLQFSFTVSTYLRCPLGSWLWVVCIIGSCWVVFNEKCECAGMDYGTVGEELLHQRYCRC